MIKHSIIASYRLEDNRVIWESAPIYGSSRVGVFEPNKLLMISTTPVSDTLPVEECKDLRGNRKYEISNHLGNVLAVITDKRTTICRYGTTKAFYEADLVSASDFYAFGSLKNGRNFSAGSGYRFGFNGKETDGETGTQDYGMRIYNPNIGKFLSLDPITKIYPMLTPYQFASNNPILNIDLDGLEGVDYTRNIILYSNGKPRFSKDDANNISKIPLYTFQISSTLFIIHNGKQISYNLSSAPTKMDLIFSVGPQAMTDIKFFSDNLLANKSNLKAKVSAATGYTDTKESKILENGFVNTFRHFAWQSTISMALGEKKAKSVGDYHEADGIKNKQKGKFWKDNVIDIANNEYARQYGKGFNFELVTRTAESYTNYLNGLAKHICSTVDGYATDKSFDKIRTGEVKLFNKTDPQVKSIYYGARSLKNTPVYVK